jgi:hypothetical protein
MTKISDQMKGNTRPTPNVSTPEGGGDMALALTSTVQSQANQLAIAAEAANISIDHASTQMAEYFTQVMSGQALLNATLAKTAANLEAMGGPIGINTEVPTITVNLPESRDFAETRRGFLGMIIGGTTTHNIPAHYIINAAPESDGEHDD